MSSGIGKFALRPSTRSISFTSSFTFAFAWFSTSLSFGPATAWRSSVCIPIFRFLMLGMSMLPTSSTSSDASMSAST